MSMAMEKDVVIVGGGVVGSASAYYLARAGKRVLLVEKGVIAGEASGRNGGHISPTVEGAWGPLGRLTLEIWPKLSEELGYPTEYRRCGSLSMIMADEAPEVEQMVAYRRECGFVAEAVSPEECAKLLPGVSRRIKGGVFSPNNGHANPILATKGLAKAAQDYGAEVWTHTCVTGIDVRDEAIVAVRTTRGYVNTPFVVNAAGPWSAHIGRMAGVEVPITARRIEILLSEAMPPLTEMIWHGNGIYSRQAVAGQLHFGAGGPPWEPAVECYDKAVPASTMQRIARRMLELMPGIADVRILRSWAGVIAPAADGTPILDRLTSPAGFVIATGFAGNGFVTGPAAGKVVSELILHNESPIDIAGLRLARFREEPEWMLAGFREWMDSSESSRETGAWDIEGVRPQTGDEERTPLRRSEAEVR